MMAEELDVSYDDVQIRLTTQDGMVFDRLNPANRVSYGRLTAGKLIEET
jgi:hypothetical protein